MRYATDLKKPPSSHCPPLAGDNNRARASLRSTRFDIVPSGLETLRSDRKENLADRLFEITHTRVPENRERLFDSSIPWRKNSSISSEAFETKNEYPRAFEKREKDGYEKSGNSFPSSEHSGTLRNSDRPAHSHKTETGKTRSSKMPHRADRDEAMKYLGNDKGENRTASAFKNRQSRLRNCLRPRRRNSTKRHPHADAGPPDNKKFKI